MHTSSNLQYTCTDNSSPPDEIFDSLFADHMTEYDEEPIEPDLEASEFTTNEYSDHPLNNERE